MVLFEADRIRAITEEVADRVGVPSNAEVRVEVDETSPLGRTGVASLDPIVITAESGALEDGRRLRHLNERGVVDVVGRLLLRVRDRLDPAFGDPPPDNQLSLEQQTAWDTYAVGRCARLGYDLQKPRRLYHFRNRHGFTDVADAVFERLWSGDNLTWADIESACAETAAAPEPARR